MNSEKLLYGLEEVLLEALEQHPEAESLDEETLAEVMETTKEELVVSTMTSLKKTAPKMLREHRRIRAGFEKRNFERWRPAFDHLEMVIVTATELGEHANLETREEDIENDDFAFEAISQLHPRALLVAQEIYCLLRGGFPDGALSRWRTLHEINATTTFISKHGNTVGLNYLASSAFNNLRSANQYNAYADRAGLQEIEQSELDELQKVCDCREKQVGRKIGRDYDWAKPAIHKDRVTLFDLEKDVGLDHWRPWFQWSCKHNHAGHREIDNLLGMSESDKTLALVGPSNSGFVDPLQLSALSLSQITSTYVLEKSNFDRQVCSEIIIQLSEEIGSLAMDRESVTMEKHRSTARSRIKKLFSEIRAIAKERQSK